MSKKKRKKKGIDLQNMCVCFLAILIAILIFNMYLINSGAKTLVEKATAPKIVEKPKISLLQVTSIGVKNCSSCLNVSAVASQLNQIPNTNITKTAVLLSGSDEAKDLVKKYNITKLPSIIVQGELNTTQIPGFVTVKDALVLAQVPPPYLDMATGIIKGRVSLIELEDPECTECTNISSVVAQLKRAKVDVTDEKSIAFESKEGKELIQKYNITQIPALILNADALEYSIVSQVWKQVGSVESDGKLVLRVVPPPFRELPSKDIKGLIDASFIIDSSCADCFNVSLLKKVLKQNFRVVFSQTRTIEVNDDKGKALIQKYNITLVPTMVLSKDAGAYLGLKQAWPQAGTIEKDGKYVFRKVEVLGGKYKNLVSGEVLNATAG